jgi:2-polyprenyl-6-methoxyphenol hydroxylase-like FAD-dependent oxidoreductase
VSMYSNGERFLRVGVDSAETPYRFMVGIEQNVIEEILEARLEALGGKVERGVRFAGFEEDPEGVEATLLHPDRTWSEARFRWVVGCDGAHSSVRKGLEMALEGSTFDERFFLADVRVSWDLSFEEVSLFSSDHGIALVLPLPGKGWVRLFGDVDGPAEPRLDHAGCMQLIAERIGIATQVQETGWATTFRVHTRMAEQFQRGRVFIAGDAAHIHSPVGGHGMNTGIHDAHNLAWKLALASRGHAHADLLATYQTERMPIAKAVLAETDFGTRISLWRNPIAKSALNTLLGLAGKIPPMRRRLIAQALETSVAYRDSPLCDEHRGSVLAAPLVHSDRTETASLGDRAAFSDGPRPGDHICEVALDGAPGKLFDLVRGDAHTILLFDGAAPTDEGYERLAGVARGIERRYGDLVRVHVVVPSDVRPSALAWDGSVILGANAELHARYGASAECAYVFRPDRYIGFRSQPVDHAALDAHLARVFGAVS